MLLSGISHTKSSIHKYNIWEVDRFTAYSAVDAPIIMLDWLCTHLPSTLQGLATGARIRLMAQLSWLTRIRYNLGGQAATLYH